MVHWWVKTGHVSHPHCTLMSHWHSRVKDKATCFSSALYRIESLAHPHCTSVSHWHSWVKDKATCFSSSLHLSESLAFKSKGQDNTFLILTALWWVTVLRVSKNLGLFLTYRSCWREKHLLPSSMHFPLPVDFIICYSASSTLWLCPPQKKAPWLLTSTLFGRRAFYLFMNIRKTNSTIYPPMSQLLLLKLIPSYFFTNPKI